MQPSVHKHSPLYYFLCCVLFCSALVSFCPRVRGNHSIFLLPPRPLRCSKTKEAGAHVAKLSVPKPKPAEVGPYTFRSFPVKPTPVAANANATQCRYEQNATIKSPLALHTSNFCLV
ncbi:hypothetical protein F5B17DRAFT_25800 [Nemania serpens]|nr:hypothetical protein F5B17DRAFT_25800 [Nemania serpens]